MPKDVLRVVVTTLLASLGLASLFFGVFPPLLQLIGYR